MTKEMNFRFQEYAERAGTECMEAILEEAEG